MLLRWVRWRSDHIQLVERAAVEERKTPVACSLALGVIV